MTRPLVVSALFALATFSGCMCSKSGANGEASDGSAASAVATNDAGSPGPIAPSAHFSNPIAATRAGGGAVLVAGLVVPDKVIAITRLEAGGGTSFTVNALRGVTWSADADLRLFPADGGAVVVWRGPRDGKPVRQMIVIGKGGELKGDPIDIGTVSCATEEAVAWTERATGGKTKVVAKGWSSPPRDVALIGSEREPVVVCGARRIYALGQGEDDMTFAASENDGGPRMVLSASEFGGDEERELSEYTVGDDLGLVRVGSGGQIALREARAAGMGAWRRLAATIPADDDLVAVDADAKTTYVVTTREAASPCTDGSTSVPSSVHALRIDRASFAETSLEVAPAECGREMGPFWTGSVGGRFVVAWAERAARRDAFSAPIAGLAYRVMEGAGAGQVVRVARAADALVDAGCDKDRCYAIALLREPKTTNIVPEIVQTIAYP